MLYTIFSIWYWVFLVGFSTIFFFFPIAVLIRALSWPFDRRLVLLHRWTCVWSSWYSWFNPLWKVSVEGRENIQSKDAYVMVSNHQSMVDILVLFRIFAHFKWVSKIENFQIPFIGWNMKMNRYVQLTRGSIRSNKQMMDDCKANLDQGSSVMIFPEGTRSNDGKLRTFKSGAFDLALKSKKPILPILLNGSSQALPKKGVIMRNSARIKIQILEPIPYEQFSELSTDELTTKIQELFTEKLADLRKST